MTKPDYVIMVHNQWAGNGEAEPSYYCPEHGVEMDYIEICGFGFCSRCAADHLSKFLPKVQKYDKFSEHVERMKNG